MTYLGNVTSRLGIRSQGSKSMIAAVVAQAPSDQPGYGKKFLSRRKDSVQITTGWESACEYTVAVLVHPDVVLNKSTYGD